MPVAPEEAEALELWLSAPCRTARCASSCRSAARSAGCSTWRRATRRSPTRRGSTPRRWATTAPSRRCAPCWRCPSLPRRIECFDISTIQGSETVASMVVCEDGRMKKGDYRKFKVEPGTRRAERFLDDFAAMKQVVQRRYARVIEQGGPFPDLIVIDGGKGQLSAAYEALESLGLANLVAVGLAKKEELIFTRDQLDPIVLPVDDPGAPAAAAHPRRGASLRRDVPSAAARQARPALGARRHPGHRPAPPASAAAALRQPHRRAARHARGTRAASSARRPPTRSCDSSRRERAAASGEDSSYPQIPQMYADMKPIGAPGNARRASMTRGAETRAMWSFRLSFPRLVPCGLARPLRGRPPDRLRLS